MTDIISLPKDQVIFVILVFTLWPLGLALGVYFVLRNPRRDEPPSRVFCEPTLHDKHDAADTIAALRERGGA